METAPIIVKLKNRRNPCDYVLDKHQFAFKMNHKRQCTAAERYPKYYGFMNSKGVSTGQESLFRLRIKLWKRL
jgi:hypothetical protein